MPGYSVDWPLSLRTANIYLSTLPWLTKLRTSAWHSCSFSLPLGQVGQTASSLPATSGNGSSSHPSHGAHWVSIFGDAPGPCTSITAPHTRSECRPIVYWVP